MTDFELNLQAEIYYKGCLAKNEARDAALAAQDRIHRMTEDSIQELKDFNKENNNDGLRQRS